MFKKILKNPAGSGSSPRVEEPIVSVSLGNVATNTLNKSLPDILLAHTPTSSVPDSSGNTPCKKPLVMALRITVTSRDDALYICGAYIKKFKSFFSKYLFSFEISAAGQPHIHARLQCKEFMPKASTLSDFFCGKTKAQSKWSYKTHCTPEIDKSKHEYYITKDGDLLFQYGYSIDEINAIISVTNQINADKKKNGRDKLFAMFLADPSLYQYNEVIEEVFHNDPYDYHQNEHSDYSNGQIRKVDVLRIHKFSTIIRNITKIYHHVWDKDVNNLGKIRTYAMFICDKLNICQKEIQDICDKLATQA